MKIFPIKSRINEEMEQRMGEFPFLVPISEHPTTLGPEIWSQSSFSPYYTPNYSAGEILSKEFWRDKGVWDKTNLERSSGDQKKKEFLCRVFKREIVQKTLILSPDVTRSVFVTPKHAFR